MDVLSQGFTFETSLHAGSRSPLSHAGPSQYFVIPWTGYAHYQLLQASIMDQLCLCLSLSWHTHLAIPLFLARVEGCPSYILSLLPYADISDTLKYLGLWLGQSSLSNLFIWDVLSCTEHFPALQDLFVHFPIGMDCHALGFPQHFQLCFVKILNTSYLRFQYTCAFICLPSTIPNWVFCCIVHSSYLLSWPYRGPLLFINSSRSDDDLEDAFCSFPPSNLRISIARLYEALELTFAFLCMFVCPSDSMSQLLLVCYWSVSTTYAFPHVLFSVNVLIVLDSSLQWGDMLEGHWGSLGIQRRFTGHRNDDL